MNNSEVSNALVNQKNLLIGMVNDGNLFVAVEMLDMMSDLWKALDYGYKVREINRRIIMRTEEEIQKEEDFLAGERKNSKSRSSTEANIWKLRGLIKHCNQD